MELAGVKSRLAGESLGRCGQFSVRCAAVGVGAVAAGIGASRTIQLGSAKAAVLIGSFGGFPGHALDLGELASVSGFEWVDSAIAANDAAFPEAMDCALSVDAGLCRGLSEVGPVGRTVRLATTAGITTSDDLAASLELASALDGENLEGFAVAMACRDHGMRLGALLAVTNVVGSKGRMQWLQHHSAGAEATAGALWAWLLSGAPGLGNFGAY